jgi:peptidoglycan/LPS O-acetylase OafA/YrhL
LNRDTAFYEPMLSVTRDQLQLGHLAVHGFFLISGWLVTQSWERSGSSVNFLRSRALRIYPAYLVCYLVTLFVIAPLGGMTWEQYRHELNLPLSLVKMVLLGGFGGFAAFPHNQQHTLNTSLWSIPIEFGCYLMIAAFAVFRAYRARAVVAGAIFLYLAVAVGTLQDWSGFATLPGAVQKLFQSAEYVDSFLIGSSYFLLRDRIPFSGRIAAVALAAFVIAARVPPLMQFVMPLTVPYTLFYFVYNPKIDIHGWGRHADLSYGIYLWAWPFQQLLTYWFEPNLNGISLFLLVMPIVCGIALLSWKFVEAPSLRLKQRTPRPVSRPGVRPSPRP